MWLFAFVINEAQDKISDPEDTIKSQKTIEDPDSNA